MFRYIYTALLLGAAIASAQTSPTLGALSAGAAPTPTNAATQGAEPLRLEQLLADVVKDAPTITRVERLSSAQRLRAQAEMSWPAPTATISYMGSAAPFRTMSMDPSSYRGLSLMQPLPLGGKRELRRAIADKQADAIALDAESLRRELRRRMREAFADDLLAVRSLALLDASREQLREMSQLAAARYGEGRGAQSEVARAQIEETLLEQKRLPFEQLRATACGAINALLGRPIDAPLPPPIEPNDERAPNANDAQERAIAEDPSIRRAYVDVQRAHLEGELARREAVPEIAVGYMYQQRSMQPDMYGLQISVELPFWQREKRRQMREAARLDAQAAASEVDARKREISAQIADANAAITAAEKNILLIHDALLPQTELALRGAGSGEIAPLLELAGKIIDARMQMESSQAARRKALAALEALTGEATKEKAQ